MESLPDSSPDSSTRPSSANASQNPVQKKPRHRHSPAQLAALNELFDSDEHPPLDKRSALALSLGMETKTVNAWFQNKRASSKKRSRGAPSYDTPPANSLPDPPSVSNPAPVNSPEFDDYLDNDYPSTDFHSRSASAVPPEIMSSFYASNPDARQFLSEIDSMPRRMRMRPTLEQTEELKKLYSFNPHPTTEQRQTLSERIGMRYQSITNWFQNQRSLAKKRKEDETDATLADSFDPSAEYMHDSRQYSAFPPRSHHHAIPPPMQPLSTYHSASRSPTLRRSLSPSFDDISPRRGSSRRSMTPYGTSLRPRRSRPEPHQLEALKELFFKTATPTIEERSAIALEIGMDVSKVTNWFRNLRQTARKRTKRSGSGEDDEFYHGQGSYSTSASRSGTPSLRSSSSSVHEDSMEMDPYDYDMQSDIGSEDEYQEAVTPSPEPSLPPPSSSAASSGIEIRSMNNAYNAELEKVSVTRYSHPNVEDALLLLSFHHQHVVH